MHNIDNWKHCMIKRKSILKQTLNSFSMRQVLTNVVTIVINENNIILSTLDLYGTR